MPARGGACAARRGLALSVRTPMNRSELHQLLVADLGLTPEPAMPAAASGAVASDNWTALSRPLDRLLGKRSANALAKLGLRTVRDLVLHVPFRLARRGELMPKPKRKRANSTRGKTRFSIHSRAKNPPIALRK